MFYGKTIQKKSIWKLLATVMYFLKLINIFYKEYSEIPIITTPFLDSTPPIARLLVLKKPKQKCGHLSKKVNKKSKS